MAETVFIFDLDGTLSDPREGITKSISAALASLGIAPPPESALERYIGPPLRESFALLLGGDDQVERAVLTFRERYGSVGLFENALYPDVPELLCSLEILGVPLLVATSKPKDYAQAILSHFGIRHLFRGIYGSEFSGERSDKGELLAHLITAEGLGPRQAVMIGDRSHDIIAARANGLESVGVTWGFGTARELLEAGAEALCGSPAELLEVLRARTVRQGEMDGLNG